MKKFVSILLALAMIAAMGITAYAAEAQITFNNATAERKYNGYQILFLTVSLKTGEHHPGTDVCDGTNHQDACYNYSYTVNPDYFEILRAETHAHAGNTVWPNGIQPPLEEVTEEQIINYLSDQTGETGNDHGTLHAVAENLLKAIGNKEPEAKNIGSNITTEIGQGYWIFVDVTDLDGEYGANSLVVVDTKGKESLTITPKTDIPRVEKKVKDIDDTELGNIMAKPWHDSADHDIGDAVPFKLTATLPSNVTYFESYNITFHDTLGAGLTLNDTNALANSPFVVLMYSSYNSAEGNNNMNTGTDVTEYFELVKNTADTCSFDVKSKQSILTIPGVTASSVFVVYYEATLNESATIGAAGNSNSVTLEYTNDPHNADSTGMTTPDKVTVFTYQVVINKVDQEGHALAGADFELYKFDPNTNNYSATPIARKTLNADGTTFTWTGLDDGEYKLVETVVPEGYNAMEAISFALSATHDELADEPQLTWLDGDVDLGAGDVATGTIEQDITNYTGTVLPSTGAEGTFLLITCGAILVVLASVFMITRKKMSIYED